MSHWHRYLVMTTVAVLLTACVGRQAPAPVEEAKQGQPPPVTQQPQAPAQPSVPAPVTAPGAMTEGVPPMPVQPGPVTDESASNAAASGGQGGVPKVRNYSWSSATSPLVARMVKADGVTSGSLLLVDSVNNQTNGTIQSDQATQALHSALAGSKFNVVSAQQLAQAKRELGLSVQDNLGTRSKALGLARKLNAQYVLYTSATGNAASPVLKMQLMLAQTGEIIWSGSGGVD